MKIGQTVTLARPIPCEEYRTTVPAGSKGRIIHVFAYGKPAYLVEFADPVRAVVTVGPHEIVAETLGETR